jgi:hypothetical protein
MSTQKLVQLTLEKLSETAEVKVKRQLETNLKFMVTDCRKLISLIEGSLQTLNDELETLNASFEDEILTLKKISQTIPIADKKEAYKIYRQNVEAQKKIIFNIEVEITDIKNKIIEKEKQLNEAKADLSILTEEA